MGAPNVATARSSSRAVDEAGVRFPTRLGLFVREGPVRLDDGGDPWANYWAGSLVLVSVFYYRTNGHPLEREYADCKDYVKILTRDARLVSDSAIRISPAGRAHSGRRAIFTSRKLGSFKGAKSQLLIFQHKDRFMKYRITYPLAHAERAEEQIDNFLRSFPWPRD